MTEEPGQGAPGPNEIRPSLARWLAFGPAQHTRGQKLFCRAGVACEHPAEEREIGQHIPHFLAIAGPNGLQCRGRAGRQAIHPPVGLPKGDGERGHLHRHLPTLTHILHSFRGHGVGRSNDLAYKGIVCNGDLIHQAQKGDPPLFRLHQVTKRGHILPPGGTSKGETGGGAAQNASQHSPIVSYVIGIGQPRMEARSLHRRAGSAFLIG